MIVYIARKAWKLPVLLINAVPISESYHFPEPKLRQSLSEPSNRDTIPAAEVRDCRGA